MLKILFLLGVISIPAVQAAAPAGWPAKLSCSECGPKGSSTANGDGPTPCWDYDITFEADGAGDTALFEQDGFQTYKTVQAQVKPGASGDELALHYLKDTGDAPTSHYKSGALLVRLKREAGKFWLQFAGVVSNLDHDRVECEPVRQIADDVLETKPRAEARQFDVGSLRVRITPNAVTVAGPDGREKTILPDQYRKNINDSPVGEGCTSYTFDFRVLSLVGPYLSYSVQNSRQCKEARNQRPGRSFHVIDLENPSRRVHLTDLIPEADIVRALATFGPVEKRLLKSTKPGYDRNLASLLAALSSESILHPPESNRLTSSALNGFYFLDTDGANVKIVVALVNRSGLSDPHSKYLVLKPSVPQALAKRLESARTRAEGFFYSNPGIPVISVIKRAN